MMDYALQNGIYVLLGGDLLDTDFTSSIGDSAYQQKLKPQNQMEEMVEILSPGSQKPNSRDIGIHRKQSRKPDNEKHQR